MSWSLAHSPPPPRTEPDSMEPDARECEHCGNPIPWVWARMISQWGWVLGNSHPGCQEAADRNERKNRTEHALRMAQVPTKYRDWTTARMILQDDLEPDWQFMGRARLKPKTIHMLKINADAAHRVSRWLPGPRWLYLEGNVGRGKTLLVSALIRSLVEPPPADFIEPDAAWLEERGLTPDHRPPGSRRRAARRQSKVMFCDWAEVMRRVRLGWKGDPAPLKQVGDVACLVLDDLGSPDKPLREAEMAAVEQLLCMRYRDERATVITSNVPWYEATDLDRPYFGHRVADRLCEVADHVALAGPSWRQPPQRPKPRQEIDRKAAAAGDVGLFGGGL